MIVGIAGRAGSGKDTVADFLVQRHGFTKVSCAGPLKAMMAACGFPEPLNRDDKEKLIPGFKFTWRQAAQDLGTKWGRGLQDDIWIQMIEQRMRRSRDRFVISDVRFDNEADMVRRMHGKMLHLYGREAALGEAASHASEAGVTIYLTLDYMINTGGSFLDTETQVREALKAWL